MKKRLLSIILAVAIVISLVSVMSVTSSADISPDGIFTYEVIGNEVTITGYTAGTLDGTLEIPATITGLPVTAIEDYAFNGCDITALKVPTGVKRIGKSAFNYCSKLETIQLPNSVNRIGSSAFDNTKWYSNQSYTYVYAGKVLYKCKNNSITGISTLSGNALNSDTVGIADGAFRDFDQLTTVHLPENIEVIGTGAFEECVKLAYVSLPKKLTFIGDHAFYNCEKLENIKCNFSDDLTQMSNLSTIEAYAFDETKWLSDQPDGSIYFAKVLYRYKNSNPMAILVKTGTKGIADRAIRNCTNLMSVSIPASVDYIGTEVFDGCSKLGTIAVDVNNGTYYSSGGCIIEKETGKLLYGTKSATIPSGVKIIGDSAFYGRTQLESIEIPAGVTVIEDYAFGACSGLKTVGIPSSVTKIGYSVFSDGTAINKVNYSCSEKEKAKIKIGTNNDTFKNATWTYHYGRKSFPDVKYTDWYGESVEYAVGAGLVKGYANGKFGTADGIQRQDFVVILSRLSGENIEYYADKDNFKDVAKGSYYAAALAWAKARGVSTGYANGKFGVGDKITREQLVTFLYRFAKLKGYNTELKLSAVLAKKSYPDASSVSSFADDAICWALGSNVIGGKEIGGKKYLAPKANAQRSEVAKMFYNIFMNDVYVEVVVK